MAILLRNGSLNPIRFVLLTREGNIHITALGRAQFEGLQHTAREVDCADVSLVYCNRVHRQQALHFGLPNDEERWSMQIA